MIQNNTLYHHGIKGQKWGVRRYQFADGTYTPAGKMRYFSNQSNSTASLMKTRVGEIVNKTRTQVTGRQYVDTYLKKGITFSRIQTSKEFEKYAFYATYKRQDIDKYMGLFGKNLTARAYGEAKRAAKTANRSGDESDLLRAKELKDRADNMNVYQLKIEATKKLKVPSDENAGYITANLLKDRQFKDNLAKSIEDSKTKMKRPTQQVLFNQAQNALRKDPGRMTSADKVSIYKAFNLSLTNHEPYQVAAQNRFYAELKKKGYNALLDYNDKDYSSYHAKRPMIVFDTNSVKLQAVTKTNPKIVNRMYRKYNAERMRKEITANTIGYVSKAGGKKISDCYSYVNRKTKRYLS